nr:putative PIF1 DNA helicase/replication protein A1-like protein [Tanacetum cinerariifolium]
MHNPPKLLMDLISENHPKTSNFIDNIRRYNSMFSFTSIGAKQDTSVNHGHGAYCYIIQGQNYHRMGTLLRDEGKPLINDPSASTTNNEIDHDLTVELRDMLDTINPLVARFHMAGERLVTITEENQYKLRLIGTRIRDGRQYNLPITFEVATLIVGDIDLTTNNRDIILYMQEGGLKRISIPTASDEFPLPDNFPTASEEEFPLLRQYTRRAKRIAQSTALPTAADEPGSPLGDDIQEEAFPTIFGLEAEQDKETIIKTSTLPHDSTPRVTSLTADEGKCLSCGALYTRDCSCSKESVEDKILVPKPSKNCARCAKCGHPVNGHYCQGCALVREKLEEDLITYFQNFQNIFESSDDSTNVVNAPRDPFVVKHDHDVNPSHIDKCCCKCGNALDGIFCQQCIFENFYFDLGEISSGSTTTHSDISLSNYEAFSFDNDHIKEISSGSTTTHSDISLSEYDSFIFDLTHEEFANELAHIISPPEYDCFYFWNFPDP